MEGFQTNEGVTGRVGGACCAAISCASGDPFERGLSGPSAAANKESPSWNRLVFTGRGL